MVEKRLIKEDVYETQQIKIGTEIKEVWETSDGLVWNDEDSASNHEFYNIKAKKRSIGFGDNTVLDCESWEDIQRYINDYGYNVDIHDYDKSKLTFPNSYVLVEEGIEGESYGLEDDYSDHAVYLRIYDLDCFKHMAIEEIRSI